MQTSLIVLDEHSKHTFAPSKGNKVVVSKLRQYAKSQIADAYSVKAVWAGQEHYRINGQSFTVGEGQFLVVNPGDEVEVAIESAKADWTTGTCLYVHPDMMDQVLNPDPLVDDRSATAAPLFQQVAMWQNSTLAPFITKARQAAWHQEAISDVFYFSLAEVLQAYDAGTKKQINRIKAAKKTTREELYRRLACGKVFIEDRFRESITLSDMAQAACMSEYHFVRSFKQVYQQSPYQFMLSMRLQWSMQQLKNDQSSIQMIAWQAGFSDLASFSKHFKRRFGVAPSQLRPRSTA